MAPYPRQESDSHSSNGHHRSSSNGGTPNGRTIHLDKNSTAELHTVKSQFTIRLSFLFLLFAFVLSSITAFGIGWTARILLLSRLGALPSSSNPTHSTALVRSKSDKAEIEVRQPTMSGKKAKQLPSPTVIEGKDVPYTTYAGKTFGTAGATTSHTLHIDRSTALLMTKSRKEFDGGPDFQHVDDDHSVDVAGGAKNVSEDSGWVDACTEKSCSRGKEKQLPSADHNDDGDGLHLPAGQHLLVDIKDVDANFLNSEERLANAVIEICNESKLTLLSYHCHSLVPVGVSCAGVLLESHVAFHTWPLEGVITLDLFTCGGGLLVPLLPLVEAKFAVPSVDVEGDKAVQPTLLWSHKLRGFREGFASGYVRSKNPLDGSLGRYVLGKLDFDVKRPLVSKTTEFHHVNIYEVLQPKTRDVTSYYKSLSTEEESYETLHREQFGPDKMLFLDGIIQSTLYGDGPYHESIVHPPMLAHLNPRRVAIIGGGEGATLREVLKHKSVEEVVILEIDRELTGICAEHMAEWSDCSDIEGSLVDSCFEDSRARVVYVDAFKWFVETYNGVEEDGEGELFDVIIMDSLDPQTSVEIAGGLYNETSFIESLYNGLAEEGVFVVQNGKAKTIHDPPEEIGRSRYTALMMEALRTAGFQSLHTYDEGHSRFYMPWEYLVAFKTSSGSDAAWHRSQSEIEVALHNRIRGTKSGKPPLRYVDAATVTHFQRPSKAREVNYCLHEERKQECEEGGSGGSKGVYDPVRERRGRGEASRVRTKGV